MPATVQNLNEISLNGVYYPITRPVQSDLASQFPPKQITGDYTKDTHPRLSVLTLNDWRGGVGLNRIIRGQGLDRTNTTSSQTLYKAGAFLPFVRGGVSGSISGKLNINELAGSIYIVFGADVRQVTNNATVAVGASLDTLPGTTPEVQDSLNFTLGTTEYLAWAHRDTTGGAYGYTYTSDGAAFTDDTKDVKYFTYWDDRLWGIDNTGQLWFSTAIGTETDDAMLRLPAGEVTALFTGPDAQGNEIIYVATQRGLYAHDAANAIFHKTGVTYPRQTNGGLSSRTWNGDIYVPVGLGVLKYTPQTGVVQNVGLDKDDGLPSAEAQAGYIQKLIPTNTLLFAEIQVGTAIGFYAFNGQGWGYWYSAAIPTSGGNSYVSSVGSYRLWVPQSTRVEYVVIPVASFNPEQDSTLTYGASGSFTTPWFDADQLEVDKLAVRLLVETVNPTTSETVTIGTGVDQETTYTTRGSAITTGGVTTITLPGNVSTDVGLAFKRIRFSITLARGSTTTNTPIIKSIVLEYRKKIPDKWSHAVEIDLNKGYGENTPAQLRAALLTAIQSNTLLEFTFQDTSGVGLTYFVDIIGHTGITASGNVPKGTVSLLLAEV